MPADRFYCRGSLTPGTIVTLEETEELHMRRVMRKKAGDIIELFNGNGILVEAQLLDSSLKVTKVLKEEKRPPLLTIAQAYIAPNKLDWLTEKCQELGAGALWLFPGDQSDKKTLSDSLLKRLKTLAINAAKQSGRLFLMDITIKPPLKEWPPYENLYFGSPKENAPRCSELPPDSIFVVGPERGFSAKEEALLTKDVSLSPYTLRTETAALVLLANHQFL